MSRFWQHFISNGPELTPEPRPQTPPPDDAEALALRGEIQLQRGRIAAAYADLKRALELKSDDAAVRALEPDSMRQRLLEYVAEMEQAGDQTDAKRLSSLVRKHAQSLALERKQRASPRVPRA